MAWRRCATGANGPGCCPLSPGGDLYRGKENLSDDRSHLYRGKDLSKEIRQGLNASPLKVQPATKIGFNVVRRPVILLSRRQP